MKSNVAASSLTPERFYDLFLDELRANVRARDLWNATVRWTNPDWTSVMTTVLARTTKALLGEGHQVCGKGEPDAHRRYEYLTLDVMGYDNDHWGPPLVIVEHENDPGEPKLQYCAWKLLCVEASLRMLVAYVDSERNYSWCFESPKALLSSLRVVARRHPDKPLFAIVGEWSQKLTKDDWSSVFGLHTVSSFP